MSADIAAGQTVEAVRRLLAAHFRDHAIDTAELDARILAGHVLGLDLTGMITAAARPVNFEEAIGLKDAAGRRLAGEPVARIIGHKEFWGLPLRLSAATLVPRPDTETVVELALEMLRATPQACQRWRIADIGTGSGAILLALLSELPETIGVGTDISATALATAKFNAAALGLRDRASFVACNYTAALRGPFDLIVSNPPYIRTADIEGLAREVRNHDPHRALDGGPDGLAAYRTIISQAPPLLAAHGALVVEVGQGQSSQVEHLMTAAGLTRHQPVKTDLAGIPRAIAGRNLPR